MKKFYLLIAFLLTVSLVKAQCEATFEIVANGNEVSGTIIGTGATVPFYTIDWGDGGSDFSQYATHIYAAPGTYTITWVYTDLANTECLLTATQQVIITGGGCSMDFTTYSFGLTTSVLVTASGAGAPAYTIDWGDGSPFDYTDQAGHIYAADGTYTICVTYQDYDNLDNCTLLQCHDVTVVAQAGDCTVNLTVTMDGSMVSAEAVGTGAINENYMITWGDNSFDNGSTGTHSYAVAGTYTVCALYGDLGPDGCTTSDCEDVVVQKIGACTLDVTAVPLGFTVGLNATGTGAANPVYTIEWGDLSPEENTVPATHTYAAAGTYQICVSYVDLNNLKNCQMVECVSVVIEESTTDCTVALTVTQDGPTINATAVGEGAVSPQYAINWGDGTFPNLSESGSHTYTAGGTYEVCVTYVDLDNFNSCNATDCETIVVVGVDEVFFGENAINVMPNPLSANSTLEINLNKSAFVRVDVIDVVGNLVENISNSQRGQGTQRFTWDTSSLAGGVYFVRVIADDQERTVRVVR